MKEFAVKLLKEESHRFEEKGYGWLVSQKYPIIFSRQCDGRECEFEVDLLEKNDEYAHIAVMVSYDDKTAYRPASDDFIVYRSADGT